MSCSACNCNPCSCSTCDAEHEPLASALDNFVNSFFGTIIKSCVDNKVVWALPCNLDSGIPGYPRISGEGLACYIFRVTEAISGGGSSGLTENIEVVQNVSYNEGTGELIQSKRTLSFTNGILTGVGGSVDSVVTTAVACP